MSGNFLDCLKGVKDTFGAQDEGGFPHDTTAEGPPARLGKSPVFLKLWWSFLSNSDGDLMDPLAGLSGVSSLTLVTRGPSEFLCSRCRGRGPHLDLGLEHQVSSLGPTWISGFLWGIWGVRSGLVCGDMHVPL